MPFQIVACTGDTIKGVTAYVTLGLSKEPLISPNSGRVIRQELLVLSGQALGAQVPGILQQLALEAIEGRTAYLRGDVIGPRGALFEKGQLEAMYVTMPVYYPESLGTYIGPDGDAIVIAWLVPITRQEQSTFVHMVGASLKTYWSEPIQTFWILRTPA